MPFVQDCSFTAYLTGMSNVGASGNWGFESTLNIKKKILEKCHSDLDKTSRKYSSNYSNHSAKYKVYLLCEDVSLSGLVSMQSIYEQTGVAGGEIEDVDKGLCDLDLLSKIMLNLQNMKTLPQGVL